MKKLLIILSLTFSLFATAQQTTIGDLVLKKSVTLGGKKLTDVSTDNSAASKSAAKLITEKAAKEYADLFAGSSSTTSAGNGLTKNANTFSLGGYLSQNTYLKGINGFSFNLDSVSAFRSYTYPNSSMFNILSMITTGASILTSKYAGTYSSSFFQNNDYLNSNSFSGVPVKRWSTGLINNLNGNNIYFLLDSNVAKIKADTFSVLANKAYYKNASNTGVFGINVTNPTQALDVDGNVKFSRALMPNANAGASGEILKSQGAGAAPVWSILNPNTFLFDSLMLYDGANGGYDKIGTGDFEFNYTGAGRTTTYTDGGFSIPFSGSGWSQFDLTTTTGFRNYVFPDKSGTVAMLDDVNTTITDSTYSQLANNFLWQDTDGSFKKGSRLYYYDGTGQYLNTLIDQGNKKWGIGSTASGDADFGWKNLTDNYTPFEVRFPFSTAGKAQLDFAQLTGNRSYWFPNSGGQVTICQSQGSTIDMPNTSAQSSSDQTISFTGASLGDVIVVGVPVSAVLPNSCYTAYVTSTNNVMLRFNNYSTAAQNPASGIFTFKILK